ncbi:MAG: hypothetical protein ACREP6_07270, partial [Candidatus Binataceae bacterium]
AWERSADVLYVLDQSIGAARCAWRFLELFNKLGIRNAELRFVLNRFDPHHPISEKQIAHTLARPIYARVPRDDKALERAQISAEDPWKAGSPSPLIRAVEELMRRLGAISEQPIPGESAAGMGGLVGRFLSAVTARS